MRAKSTIALLLILASATGCTSGHEAQVALPDQLVPVWSAAIAPNDQDNVLAVTADSVIATTPDGNLVILDAQTGRLKRTIEPGTDWSSTSGGRVIGERLYTYGIAQGDGNHSIAAYDLSTGRLLWMSDVPQSPYGVFEGDNPTITPRGIVVPVGAAQDGAADALEGISLTDGGATWTAQLPSGCPRGQSPDGPDASTSGVSIARAAVFLMECTNAVRLVTVDPADGRISWQHVLPANSAPFLAFNPTYSAVATTNLGDIVAKTGTTERIFTSSGRLIATRACPDSDDCNIDAVGRIGVLNTHRGETPIEQGLDLSTGQMVWQRTRILISNYSGSAASPDYGGTLFAEPDYSVVNPKSGLLPQFVTVMQASTGRSTILPLPLVGPASSVLGSAGHLLIVAEEGVEKGFIMALRPEHVSMGGPAVLGGVTAADWPNACKLLIPADLRFISARYVAAPRPVTLPGVTWQKPVRCTYIGPDTRDPVVTLTIAWTAASNQQAEQLLRSKLTVLPIINCGPQYRQLPSIMCNTTRESAAARVASAAQSENPRRLLDI